MSSAGGHYYLILGFIIFWYWGAFLSGAGKLSVAVFFFLLLFSAKGHYFLVLGAIICPDT